MLKKIMLSLCVLGVAISTASARNYLMLYKIINDTNQNITVLVSTGGESSGYLAGYEVPHNSSIMTENHAVDVAGDINKNKYVQILHIDHNNNNVVSKKVPYSTQWHGGLRPYYTVTQENVTSGPNYVYVFKGQAYATLKIDLVNGEYKYTWKSAG